MDERLHTLRRSQPLRARLTAALSRLRTNSWVCAFAGNSVHADKKFLDKYMPQFMRHLHYRIIDVSTVKELCRRVLSAAAALPPLPRGSPGAGLSPCSLFTDAGIRRSTSSHQRRRRLTGEAPALPRCGPVPGHGRAGSLELGPAAAGAVAVPVQLRAPSGQEVVPEPHVPPQLWWSGALVAAKARESLELSLSAPLRLRDLLTLERRFSLPGFLGAQPGAGGVSPSPALFQSA